MQSSVSETFRILQDPIRLALVEVLGNGPARSGELAERVGVSTAVASRHLKALLDHGFVERFDVVGDGRGRTYRLRAGAVTAVESWLRQQHWAEQLPDGEPTPDAAIYQRRIGELLDAFAHGDVQTFEQHISDDALFVFPDFPRVMTKADVLSEVADHPPFLSWDLTRPGELSKLPGGATILTSTVRSTTTDRTSPTAFHVAATFANAADQNWKLHHMQWTRATELPHAVEAHSGNGT
ncbi:MAG: winged helix-turn-helix domain-containing protein [Actinomycetota bacterium]